MFFVLSFVIFCFSIVFVTVNHTVAVNVVAVNHTVVVATISRTVADVSAAISVILLLLFQ